jgi:hypothetical protein
VSVQRPNRSGKLDRYFAADCPTDDEAGALAAITRIFSAPDEHEVRHADRARLRRSDNASAAAR